MIKWYLVNIYKFHHCSSLIFNYFFLSPATSRTLILFFAIQCVTTQTDEETPLKAKIVGISYDHGRNWIFITRIYKSLHFASPQSDLDMAICNCFISLSLCLLDGQYVDRPTDIWLIILFLIAQVVARVQQ